MDNAKKFKNELAQEIIFFGLRIDRLFNALYLEYNDVILQIYIRQKKELNWHF